MYVRDIGNCAIVTDGIVIPIILIFDFFFGLGEGVIMMTEMNSALIWKIHEKEDNIGSNDCMGKAFDIRVSWNRWRKEFVGVEYL